jgi:glycosyltransferase involved in cell wall biosynthesis
VLFPVYNNLAHLDAALASLRRQTFSDFEVIAVDDGSSDRSLEALEQAAAGEPRLHVVATRHRGLPLALNEALAHARGRLVARHDADDVSHRERFQLQVGYLSAHPGVQVVGARMRLFPSRAAGAGMHRYARWHNALLTHDEMAREALIESPLAHGTAMIRREALEAVGGWRERGWPEDMDLWLRMVERGARLAKLPRVLYGWRQHPGSATRSDPRYATERFLALKLHFLGRWLRAGWPGHAVALVGTGTSGERWHGALAAGHAAVRYRPARSPEALRELADLEPPLVLVFGALAARTRWRRALEARRLVERRHFVFVA